MSLRGITFHTEQTPQAVTKSDDGFLTLKTNKGSINGFSHVMFATGRKPNTKVNTMFNHFPFFLVKFDFRHTEYMHFLGAYIWIQTIYLQNLGLEEVGVKMDKHGAIVVCVLKPASVYSTCIMYIILSLTFSQLLMIIK